MNNYLLGFLLGFVLSLVISPIIFKLAKKLKAKQSILQYVKEHKGKEGTPTMGGLIFIFGTMLSSLIFLQKDSTLALISIVSMFAFGILGFLDDFIKIKFKQNLGLRAYQKFLGQIGISIIISFFTYKFLGGEIFIPFTLQTIDLGFWIVPLVFFVFLAFVNSVNLIDGLDGLATGVSITYLFAINVMLIIFLPSFNLIGSMFIEQQNIILISFIMLGSLLTFLLLNCFTAKIFMGDTGALALGGFLTCISIFSKFILLIPIIGIMFVITTLSDILQVAYYKLKKKRIFKMAPFHHHLQMCGMHENRVVTIYIIVTIIMFVSTLILTNMFGVL